jgi:transcriptional regulator with XRE-family HTH domain
MVHESFGTRLRRQRERKQVTLSAIAERTKIHQPLLEDLERDEVGRWPSGIFRRAFIRAYAEAIGLQPDDVVREFLTIHPDPIEMAPGPAAPERPSVTGFIRRLVGATVDEKPEPAPAPAPVKREIFDLDLLAASHLCTKLAQADAGSDVTLLLHEAARILDAVGVIVWVWDPEKNSLTPTLTDGYSERVIAQLPEVARDADNATAAAFRSSQTRTVAGGEDATGALAVPVMAPGGCVGVLAVELPHGAEKIGSIRAVATMIAAQLGRLVEPMPAWRRNRYEQSGLRQPSAANACA